MQIYSSFLFLITLTLSLGAFADDRNFDLLCSSPDASSTLWLSMAVEADKASGSYSFQASETARLSIGLSFDASKGDREVYIISNSEKRSLALKEADSGQWVALLTLKESGVQITLPCNQD